YDETTSDDLQCTAASAASDFNILVGSLTVGNGTPGQTIDGEDVYIEGLVEIDGVIYSDGGAIVGDDVAVAWGAGSDWSCLYDETTSDDFQCTAASAASDFNILVGSLTVGNGTPDQTIDGEDAYIEGLVEIDGELYADAGVTTTDIVDAGSDIAFTTNSNTQKTLVAPFGYISATEVLTAPPFSGFTATGLPAGAAHTGAAEGYVAIDDAADVFLFGLTVPELATVGAAADLIIEFDAIEDTDEECNLDIRVFEYGNTTPIVTDTLTMANAAARGWVTLDTLATGIGALVSVGEFLLIEVTINADTDDVKIYGARVTYSSGVENDA
ncbi:MAG: hypothetical protein P9L99_14230, partial [Candidatus Lernaella stagnicola]|nr:hypothetical protein [Candidatus Lernaella stagnicola]